MEQSAAAYFQKALAKFRQKDVVGGLSDLEEALRLDPSRWEFFWTRGAYNYRRRAYKLAEADLTKAIALCSDVKKAAKIYQRRMFCYGHLKRYDRLVEDADWLIERGFQDGSVYEWRAWGKNRRFDLDGAIEDYSRALALFPDTEPESVLTQFDRAILYYNSKKYLEALDNLNDVIESRRLGQYPLMDVYELRALTFYHLSDFEKSCNDFNQRQQLAGLKSFSDIQFYVENIKARAESYFFVPGMLLLPSDRMMLKQHGVQD